VEELEFELQRTRDDLQNTIEELKASNEELKSANEELQSTNEELQSTNEELETSKEEMQSLNEESATVNSELQTRIDQLSSINDDMKNLLDSTAIAAVFLDTECQIRGFTPMAQKIIPLTASDTGRPINDLASSLVETDLLELGEKVLKDLGVIEVEVSNRAGQDYRLRARPYRTLANLIDGVVFTFEDCTERNQTLRELEATEQIGRLAFEFAVDAMVLIELPLGTILRFNQIANNSLGFSPAEFSQLKVSELSPGLSSQLENISANSESPGEKRFTPHQFYSKSRKPLDFLLNMRTFCDGGRHFCLLTWRLEEECLPPQQG
jgi:two-component system CheB/CheR fusion protein